MNEQDLALNDLQRLICHWPTNFLCKCSKIQNKEWSSNKTRTCIPVNMQQSYMSSFI